MERIRKLVTGQPSVRRYVAAGALTVAAAVALLTAVSAGAKSQGPAQAAKAAAVPAEGYDITKLCGTKKITVGLADGFGGNSWRKITRAEFEAEAKKCPNITKVIYTDGQNNPQKAIADINAQVANGVNVLVLFPDAGAALLPAIRAATKAGVKVVPEVSGPGGVAGKDYVVVAKEDVFQEGVTYAEWIVKALKGKGNVIFLGGTPGNPYSAEVAQGIKSVFAKNPGMKLLAGPVDTNWDPAQTQKVVAGLLTKYPQIDGMISDYGGGSVGGVRAFVAANKPLIPWVVDDENEFSCLWYKYKGAKNPKYQIASVSSRNWVSRLALRKGLAAFNGINDPEPAVVKLPLVEDSLDGAALKPKCDPTLPPDAILSSHLTIAQLKALFK